MFLYNNAVFPYVGQGKYLSMYIVKIHRNERREEDTSK